MAVRTALRFVCACALVSVSVGYISIRRTQNDGFSKSEVMKHCTQLAPGVNYCQEIGKRGVDLVIDVQWHTPPVRKENDCRKSAKVKKDSMLLIHHTGSFATDPSGPFTTYFKHQDFTVANATRVGKDTLAHWDTAVEGLCEGEKVTITLPPQLGFDEDKARIKRPGEVPVGATLRFEVEIIKVLFVDKQGLPYRPCFFSLIDTDGSGDLARGSRV